MNRLIRIYEDGAREFGVERSVARLAVPERCSRSSGDSVSSELPGLSAGPGYHLVLSHELVSHVLAHPETFSSAAAGTQIRDPGSADDLRYVRLNRAAEELHGVQRSKRVEHMHQLGRVLHDERADQTGHGQLTRRGRGEDGAEKLGCGGELAVSAVERWIDLVRPVDQEGRGEDQVDGDDRGDHQRRDLSADTPEIQKPCQLHDQPLAGVVTAFTVGVNK